jgi:hypothetical protein
VNKPLRGPVDRWSYICLTPTIRSRVGSISFSRISNACPEYPHFPIKKGRSASRKQQRARDRIGSVPSTGAGGLAISTDPALAWIESQRRFPDVIRSPVQN